MNLKELSRNAQQRTQEQLIAQTMGNAEAEVSDKPNLAPAVDPAKVQQELEKLGMLRDKTGKVFDQGTLAKKIHTALRDTPQMSNLPLNDDGTPQNPQQVFDILDELATQPNFRSLVRGTELEKYVALLNNPKFPQEKLSHKISAQQLEAGLAARPGKKFPAFWKAFLYDSKNSVAAEHLGDEFADLGNSALALTYYQKALALGSQNPDLHLRSAKLFAASGQNEEALQAYQDYFKNVDAKQSSTPAYEEARLEQGLLQKGMSTEIADLLKSIAIGNAKVAELSLEERHEILQTLVRSLPLLDSETQSQAWPQLLIAGQQLFAGAAHGPAIELVARGWKKFLLQGTAKAQLEGYIAITRALESVHSEQAGKFAASRDRLAQGFEARVLQGHDLDTLPILTLNYKISEKDPAQAAAGENFRAQLLQRRLSLKVDGSNPKTRLDQAFEIAQLDEALLDETTLSQAVDRKDEGRIRRALGSLVNSVTVSDLIPHLPQSREELTAHYLKGIRDLEIALEEQRPNLSEEEQFQYAQWIATALATYQSPQMDLGNMGLDRSVFADEAKRFGSLFVAKLYHELLDVTRQNGSLNDRIALQTSVDLQVIYRNSSNDAGAVAALLDPVSLRETVKELEKLHTMLHLAKMTLAVNPNSDEAMAQLAGLALGFQQFGLTGSVKDSTDLFAAHFDSFLATVKPEEQDKWLSLRQQVMSISGEKDQELEQLILLANRMEEQERSHPTNVVDPTNPSSPTSPDSGMNSQILRAEIAYRQGDVDGALEMLLPFINHGGPADALLQTIESSRRLQVLSFIQMSQESDFAAEAFTRFSSNREELKTRQQYGEAWSLVGQFVARGKTIEDAITIVEKMHPELKLRGSLSYEAQNYLRFTDDETTMSQADWEEHAVAFASQIYHHGHRDVAKHIHKIIKIPLHDSIVPDVIIGTFAIASTLVGLRASLATNPANASLLSRSLNFSVYTSPFTAAYSHNSHATAKGVLIQSLTHAIPFAATEFGTAAVMARFLPAMTPGTSSAAYATVHFLVQEELRSGFMTLASTALRAPFEGLPSAGQFFREWGANFVAFGLGAAGGKAIGIANQRIAAAQQRVTARADYLKPYAQDARIQQTVTVLDRQATSLARWNRILSGKAVVVTTNALGFAAGDIVNESIGLRDKTDLSLGMRLFQAYGSAMQLMMTAQGVDILSRGKLHQMKASNQEIYANNYNKLRQQEITQSFKPALALRDISPDSAAGRSILADVNLLHFQYGENLRSIQEQLLREGGHISHDIQFGLDIPSRYLPAYATQETFHIYVRAARQRALEMDTPFSIRALLEDPIRMDRVHQEVLEILRPKVEELKAQEVAFREADTQIFIPPADRQETKIFDPTAPEATQVYQPRIPGQEGQQTILVNIADANRQHQLIGEIHELRLPSLIEGLRAIEGQIATLDQRIEAAERQATSAVESRRPLRAKTREGDARRLRMERGRLVTRYAALRTPLIPEILEGIGRHISEVKIEGLENQVRQARELLENNPEAAQEVIALGNQRLAPETTAIDPGATVESAPMVSREAPAEPVTEIPSVLGDLNSANDFAKKFNIQLKALASNDKPNIPEFIDGDIARLVLLSRDAIPYDRIEKLAESHSDAKLRAETAVIVNEVQREINAIEFHQKKNNPTEKLNGLKKSTFQLAEFLRRLSSMVDMLENPQAATQHRYDLVARVEAGEIDALAKGIQAKQDEVLRLTDKIGEKYEAFDRAQAKGAQETQNYLRKEIGRLQSQREEILQRYDIFLKDHGQLVKEVVAETNLETPAHKIPALESKVKDIEILMRKQPNLAKKLVALGKAAMPQENPTPPPSTPSPLASGIRALGRSAAAVNPLAFGMLFGMIDALPSEAQAIGVLAGIVVLVGGRQPSGRRAEDAKAAAPEVRSPSAKSPVDCLRDMQTLLKSQIIQNQALDTGGGTVLKLKFLINEIELQIQSGSPEPGLKHLAAISEIQKQVRNQALSFETLMTALTIWERSGGKYASDTARINDAYRHLFEISTNPENWAKMTPEQQLAALKSIVDAMEVLGYIADELEDNNLTFTRIAPPTFRLVARREALLARTHDIGNALERISREKNLSTPISTLHRMLYDTLTSPNWKSKDKDVVELAIEKLEKLVAREDSIRTAPPQPELTPVPTPGDSRIELSVNEVLAQLAEIASEEPVKSGTPPEATAPAAAPSQNHDNPLGDLVAEVNAHNATPAPIAEPAIAPERPAVEAAPVDEILEVEAEAIEVAPSAAPPPPPAARRAAATPPPPPAKAPAPAPEPAPAVTIPPTEVTTPVMESTPSQPLEAQTALGIHNPDSFVLKYNTIRDFLHNAESPGLQRLPPGTLQKLQSLTKNEATTLDYEIKAGEINENPPAIKHLFKSLHEELHDRLQSINGFELAFEALQKPKGPYLPRINQALQILAWIKSDAKNFSKKPLGHQIHQIYYMTETLKILDEVQKHYAANFKSELPIDESTPAEINRMRDDLLAKRRLIEAAAKDFAKRHIPGEEKPQSWIHRLYLDALEKLDAGQSQHRMLIAATALKDVALERLNQDKIDHPIPFSLAPDKTVTVNASDSHENKIPIFHIAPNKGGQQEITLLDEVSETLEIRRAQPSAAKSRSSVAVILEHTPAPAPQSYYLPSEISVLPSESIVNGRGIFSSKASISFPNGEFSKPLMSLPLEIGDVILVRKGDEITHSYIYQGPPQP